MDFIYVNCYKLLLFLVFVFTPCLASSDSYIQDVHQELTNVGTESFSSEQSIIGAIYFMTNDPRGNSIVATTIQHDGKLGFSKSYLTGGFGGYLVSAGNTSGIDPDSLGSQNRIVISDDNLFLVNPGSNSVSFFKINRHSPIELNFIKTFPSGGEFPVALAVSTRLHMLCVLNGGAKNGVQCYSVARYDFVDSQIVPLPHVSRSLGLNLLTPPFYLGAVSDILFTPDSTQLLVSVRGNNITGLRGFLGSFHIEQNAIANLVKNDPAGSWTLYGIGVVPGTGIDSDPIVVFTDTRGNGFGLAKIQGRGVVEASRIKVIPGQVATCWTAFSARSGHLFTTDPVTNLVTESRLHLDSLSAQIVNQYRIPGAPMDEVILSLEHQDILYVLTPRLPGIHVMSLAIPGEAEIIQRYVPDQSSLQFPLNPGAIGLASYLINS